MSKSECRRNLKDDREAKGLCVYCGKHPPLTDRKGCESCLKAKVIQNGKTFRKSRERSRAYQFQVRVDVLKKYGEKCACCGEEQVYFLTIDHKNNDGWKERRELYGNKAGASYSWFLKLRKEELRGDLQVLCHNCNLAKSLYGKCPHDPTFTEIDLTLLQTDNRRRSNFNLGCKIQWPSDEELVEMVKNSNCSEVARQLGVNHTAVRGRLKRRNLPPYQVASEDAKTTNF